MFIVPRVLYFRRAPHDSSLVFASPERARFIDQIHCAIVESSTWGEFRQRLPVGEYQNLFAEQFSSDPEIIAEDDSAREPADDEGFPGDVPGYSDGDYPPWLAPEQGRYLPADVLKEFATREQSSLNGGFWRVDVSRLESIVERLASLGYQVERREDLKFW